MSAIRVHEIIVMVHEKTCKLLHTMLQEFMASLLQKFKKLIFIVSLHLNTDETVRSKW